MCIYIYIYIYMSPSSVPLINVVLQEKDDCSLSWELLILFIRVETTSRKGVGVKLTMQYAHFLMQLQGKFLKCCD